MAQWVQAEAHFLSAFSFQLFQPHRAIHIGMESKSAVSAFPNRQDITKRPRTRRAAAAFEDVVVHLNDPNYDLRPPSTLPPSYRSVWSLALDQDRADTEAIPPSGEGARRDIEEPLNSRRVATQSSSSNEHDEPEESPYAEVRAAVPNVDCPWMPVNTFRVWLLGIFFTVLISGLNQLFHLRTPSLLITGLVAQLTALPLGKVLEWTLPTTRFHTFGLSWSLNPGPFSVKEHVVITAMVNVIDQPLALDIFAVLQFFYKQSPSFSYQIMLTVSTQLIGLSMGGLLRQFVVWPAAMIWPSVLVNCAVFTTLHKNYGMAKSGRLSREKYFCIALACSFVWYWVPGYLWDGLSVFNWVCWVTPKNIVVNQLFGTVSGLGMSVLTMDWAVISSWMRSPLVTPWWSQANTIVSFVVFFWIFTPLLYYTNTWYAKFLPISSRIAYTNMQSPYDPTAILTDTQFDVEKYRAYSPAFLTTTHLMTYGAWFALLPAVIVHTFLWYRNDIARRFKSSIWDEHDLHSRFMQVYPEVPHWWYAILGSVSVVMLTITIKIFPTQLPIWGMIIALLLSILFTIPLAMIEAITNQRVTLNVASEILAGYAFEGKPVANMIFKVIGCTVSSQASSASYNMKLGHYMKVPPRVMFTALIVTSVINCFITQGVQQAMFLNIADICTAHRKDGFTCPYMEVTAAASLIWGGIGPQRLFSPGAIYNNLLWFLLIGALAPIPFYFLSLRFPYSSWRYLNMPVFFLGAVEATPASGSHCAPWSVTGFIFNFYIRRRHFTWWYQYNYILSGALDAGVALGVIAVFFTLQLPKGGINFSWWGNTLWQDTADANRMPLQTLRGTEIFGQTSWS